MTKAQPGFIRVPFAEMLNTFHSALLKNGMRESKALTCASIFATNSLEGVYSHGVNRFARVVQYIKDGHIKVHEEPALVNSVGSIEQWNGNLGPGVLNALQSTERAITIATQHGLGCVALANTNHWMRGGYYGWHAARRGYVFIGWTNTLANMPAWGAVDAKLGNNPLVIAVPYQDDAIVVDMAMSQYSYGALDIYRSRNEKLPTPGGYDTNGNLTDDPESIRATGRMLPIGYWKGSGLSLLLDILAAILSGGMSTAQISKLHAEYSLSQVFIVIDLSKLNNYASIKDSIREIVSDYHTSTPDIGVKRVRYPGERAEHLRRENMEMGIPVSEKVWEEIVAL